jgi:FkbM family methyltransferase
MNNVKITYGTEKIQIDVTEICFQKLRYRSAIIIPRGDCNRAHLFTDPVFNTLKTVFITVDNITTEYDDTIVVKIDATNHCAITTMTSDSVHDILSNIHIQYPISYGNWNDEYPEQVMACMYLTGDEKVLEIGGNIGRNTLVISALLQNKHNLLTFESDESIALKLQDNRDNNKLPFHIESRALSKRKLIQRGWETYVSDVVKAGFTEVKTITLDEIKQKYSIPFDTLVIDCEGAFYYILIDMPEILDNIQLIIMENDYADKLQKAYVDAILTEKNFFVHYREKGGLDTVPCHHNFFEVWIKRIDP